MRQESSPQRIPILHSVNDCGNGMRMGERFYLRGHMSRIDQEAVRMLHSLGYDYVHRWTAPANINSIITTAGYYSASQPRYIVNITTEPGDAIHGVFIGQYTRIARSATYGRRVRGAQMVSALSRRHTISRSSCA
jgi:hypothetical protein